MYQLILTALEKEAEKQVLQIPASLDNDEFTSLFNEKLAELIVRECAAQCLSDDSMRIFNHFGVEL